MVNSVDAAEFVDHLKDVLVQLQLLAVHVDPLYVLREFNRSVDLNLLVGCSALASDFLRF